MCKASFTAETRDMGARPLVAQLVVCLIAVLLLLLCPRLLQAALLCPRLLQAALPSRRDTAHRWDRLRGALLVRHSASIVTNVVLHACKLLAALLLGRGRLLHIVYLPHEVAPAGGGCEQGSSRSPCLWSTSGCVATAPQRGGMKARGGSAPRPTCTHPTLRKGSHFFAIERISLRCQQVGSATAVRTKGWLSGANSQGAESVGTHTFTWGQTQVEALLSSLPHQGPCSLAHVTSLSTPFHFIATPRQRLHHSLW